MAVAGNLQLAMLDEPFEFQDLPTRLQTIAPRLLDGLALQLPRARQPRRDVRERPSLQQAVEAATGSPVCHSPALQ